MDANIHYLVREAQKRKDEVKLAQILSECFGPVTPRQLGQWIWKPEVKTFVCEVEGNVISHIDVAFKELHLGEGVYVKTGGIGGVCTCSEYRRKGMMTGLMQQTLAYIKNTGVSNSGLYTGLMLPAHRIYQRCGFCDVQTWPFYVKILDPQYVFRTWLRDLNRHLKVSKIAQTTLQSWNRSVVFELTGVGVRSFRFNCGRFRRLPKPPKSADIIITTDLETLFRIMWGAIKFEDAVKTGKMQVKRGNKADLQMLRKILIRIWDE